MMKACVFAILVAGVSWGAPAATVRPAERLVFPGVIRPNAEPNADGEIDCNSPAHWDGDTLYMFYSTGHPFRTSGKDLLHLSRPSRRVAFDNEEGWKMGGRWIEATLKADDGTLYMWYHNEPPVKPDRTAPRIGAMVSADDGMTWQDLGIVLEAPADSLNTASANKYFLGGNGDFCVNADLEKEYIYFFISTYNKDVAEQGVAVARMRYADRDNPRGKVQKWHKGAWNEPGIGGHVTPIFPAAVDWHLPVVDAFWGPSIHWNTAIGMWVMLLNRAKDKDWAQEGIYVSFSRELGDPAGWSKPAKILDAKDLERSKWYPQVVGTDAKTRETDKIAGKDPRLFVAGVSRWTLSLTAE